MAPCGSIWQVGKPPCQIRAYPHFAARQSREIKILFEEISFAWALGGIVVQENSIDVDIIE